MIYYIRMIGRSLFAVCDSHFNTVFVGNGQECLDKLAELTVAEMQIIP